MSSLLQHAEALEEEAAEHRVAYFEDMGVAGPLVLDVGCGNGYSVAAWLARGYSAVGVDVSLYRLSRWVGEHPLRRPFAVADARSLPFRCGQFTDVMASGLLEHIGVEESSAPYSVQALSTKRASRTQALNELLRVASRSGSVVVDFPNGLFPVDFWHGDRVGGFRVHRVPDPLNPSLGELRAYLPGCSISLLPLRDRLRFRQISRRWWGRLFSPPMRAMLQLLDRLPMGSADRLKALLYPFLVVRVRPPAEPQPVATPACFDS